MSKDRFGNAGSTFILVSGSGRNMRIGVGVGLGVGVYVGVGTRVAVRVGAGTGDAVCVGVGTGVAVCVGIGSGVAVCVGIGSGVAVRVGASAAACVGAGSRAGGVFVGVAAGAAGVRTWAGMKRATFFDAAPVDGVAVELSGVFVTGPCSEETVLPPKHAVDARAIINAAETALENIMSTGDPSAQSP